MWWFLVFGICASGGIATCDAGRVSFPLQEDIDTQQLPKSEANPPGRFRETVLNNAKPEESDRINGPYQTRNNEVKENSPCAVIGLTNDRNLNNVQSLLRKYRYDANGVLKPESVQYFFKMPRDSEDGTPELIPLDSKAFSPHGGFIRYYKEIAPIPPSIQLYNV